MKTKTDTSIIRRDEAISLSFAEKEQICESNFYAGGPFWHLYTDGRMMQDIFLSEDDFKAGMAVLAVTICLFSEVKVVTFEIMTNHLHIITAGEKQKCLLMFDTFKDKLKRVFAKSERAIDWNAFQAEILPIEDLKALRNEIIYVNRNAFVANPQYTPYNYPWGGGCAYFNPMIHRLPTTRLDSLTYDMKRKLTHSRDISGAERLEFTEDIVHIPSFCEIRLGESMFADARSYFHLLTRNAEAFSQIASRLKDQIFLTDEELYLVAIKYAQSEFGVRQMNLLDPDQKIRIAKELHFRYNASNQQLRRLLRLDISILNELFP